ncbi:uncharacterized protein LOC121402267 [Xenopus laevis]|uniref:Uncharacterized protein LOC121402267 n=1 Tax=Xenopus laevis TaxID=8355 RepID=A0A8J1MUW5_XENLA|nr:uncharacterized protein LOC121402267 [Xenopus laevis]XP_041444810.1 uncharacterized protein LOC121402267 [Xenopus laevis]XP_041444811.1 uncharacterized protein LOC121402267 [Xenopus laevis]OCT59315.1 hypothetical protein XELAEV_18000736mg [Xenopus laevis]
MRQITPKAKRHTDTLKTIRSAEAHHLVPMQGAKHNARSFSKLWATPKTCRRPLPFMATQQKQKGTRLQHRLERAEDLNKKADKLLCQNLIEIERKCLRQVAEVNLERKMLWKELKQVQTDVTPSLESLEMELPPDLPDLSRKRYSLPILGTHGCEAGGESRRYWSGRRSSCSSELQRKVSNFITKVERFNSFDSVGLLTDDGKESTGQKQDLQDTGKAPTEITLDDVKSCRYISHRNSIPRFEQELKLEEIFSEDETSLD